MRAVIPAVGERGRELARRGRARPPVPRYALPLASIDW